MTRSSEQHRAPRILVVRNDKLGDFMLAWPVLACLKRANPDNHVSVLVPAYTASLASACPWIDEVIVDPGKHAGRQAQQTLLARMREADFTALLTLFSTSRVAWLGWRAGIPLRLAPATKWAQLFYNHRITQRRSRSQKPEYHYNLELAEALLARLGQPSKPVAPPYWPLPSGTRPAQRARLADELGLDGNRPWLFIHPGSGGSAVNLSLAQYAQLAVTIERTLASNSIVPQWLLTAGPGEEQAARKLADTLGDEGLAVGVPPPREGLEDFALTLAAADMLIAGSTGPLHMAGCLNLPTAGFYPAKRSSTPLRWETCNAEDRRLAFSPPSDSESDMSRIDLTQAAQQISALVVARRAVPAPGS
ncbi:MULTISPECIES: glycosyltransferase family 9 protein [Halomonadaceae]|uniref:glycosyltransferase family 9 protein n=1 Tax=Halomonadaceae TaxID=28256 RepID=UPI00159AA469|nr:MULTISPECIES: glycosyltransferase family 9 protein [Halomonas]QJQ95578.1 glycosyltransferase family 9 protein [Halomonas sp. PA5]